MLRRFLSLFAAFIVLFCVSVPAFATGATVGGGVGIPIVGNINLDVVDFFDYVRDDARWCANWIGNKLDQDVCPYAPQLGGGHKFVPVRTSKDGQVGMYYQCQYCGKAYGDMLEEAYADYVDELPATQIDSSGSFLWRPSWSDFVDSAPISYVSDDSRYGAGVFSGTLSASVSQYAANFGRVGWSSIRATPGVSVVWTVEHYCAPMDVSFGNAHHKVHGPYRTIHP